MECFVCYDEFCENNPRASPDPCKCRGTIAIHLACLRDLMKTNDCCMTCRHVYDKEKYLSDYEKLLLRIKSEPKLIKYFLKKTNETLIMDAIKVSPRSFLFVTKRFQKAEHVDHLFSLNYIPFRYPNIIKHIRKDLLTGSVYLRLVAAIPFFLKFINAEHQTFEMCSVAVTNDGESVKYVKIWDNLTDDQAFELCLSAARHSYDRHCFKYIPKKILENREHFIELVQNNYSYMQYLPTEWITYELWLEVCKNYYENYFIDKIEHKYFTEELCEAIVETTPSAVFDIPSQFINYDIVFKTVLTDPHIISSGIPKEFQTRELCETILNRDPHLIEYLNPKNDSDMEYLCDFAIGNNSNSIFCIPKKFRTNERINQVFDDCPNVIRFIKDPTDQQIARAIEHNPINLRFIPWNKQTDALIEMAIDKDPACIAFVADQKEEFCWQALHKDPSCLNEIRDFSTAMVQYALMQPDIRLETLLISTIPACWKKLSLEQKKQIVLNKPNILTEFGDYVNFTYEEVKMFVSLDGEMLQRIPKCDMTTDICEDAVRNKPAALRHVPKPFLTLDLCKKATTADPDAMLYVPVTWKKTVAKMQA
jgi:hypothetical protein